MPFLAFIASPLGKICGYGLIALVLLATAAGIKARWDAGGRAITEVHQIVTASKVETKAVAKVDSAVAASDTEAQAKIVTVTRIIHEKVPVYVTARTPCIPWSVVRVHDAAVLGVDPSTLQAPPGATDDACSDVTPRAFVDDIVDNYAAARANAQQLADLEADAARREVAVQPAGVVAPP